MGVFQYVSAQAAREVIDAFRTRGFWSLCGTYEASFPLLVTSDRGFMETTVQIGEQRRRVTDIDSAAPAWLRDLTDAVTALGDSERRMRTGPPEGRTSLMNAVLMRAASEVETELRTRPDLEAKDAYGWTALMFAVRRSPATLRALLDAGADPNARSLLDETALMFVRMEEAARLLIAAGADVNARDHEGRTALMRLVAHFPAGIDPIDTIRLLVDAGARTDFTDPAGPTVFDYIDQDSPLARESFQDDYVELRTVLGL